MNLLRATARLFILPSSAPAIWCAGILGTIAYLQHIHMV